MLQMTLTLQPRGQKYQFGGGGSTPERVTVEPQEMRTLYGSVTSLGSGSFIASFEIGHELEGVVNEESGPIYDFTKVYDDSTTAWQRAQRGVVEQLSPRLISVEVLVGAAGQTFTFPQYKLLDNPDDNLKNLHISVDFAKVIVGHTSSDKALLWFCWHGWIIRPGDRYVCEVVSHDLLDQRRSFPVEFSGLARTAVVPVPGLRSATKYLYSLRLLEGGAGTVESGRILASGEFTTAPAPGSPNSLSFVFGSCHHPKSESDLERWKTLAGRQDFDLMLLIGDQIYEEGIKGRGDEWFQLYSQQYHDFWRHRPMREVLRRTPTYMIFDDHDVKDDWGTNFPRTKDEITRKNQALLAYQAFQDSHNPDQDSHNPKRHNPDGPFHYSFRWGPAAFFVLDCRSQREILRYPTPVTGTRTQPTPPNLFEPLPPRSNHPILGESQFDALARWATHEAREDGIDVAFVVSTVPMAFLPAREINRIIEQIKDRSEEVGDDATWIPWADGEYALTVSVGKLREHGLGDPFTRDLADLWTQRWNQGELVKVLDLLFDLANDVGAGSYGNRRRGVFILGGDVHVGAIHKIESLAERHRANPFIYQLTSSPISEEPVGNGALLNIIRHIQPGKRVTRDDIAAMRANFQQWAGEFFGTSPAGFPLDDTGENRFHAKIEGDLADRNFGRVSFTRPFDDKRVYRFNLSIEGRSAAVTRSMELHLDAEGSEANPVERGDDMRPGEVLNPDQSITSANGRYRFIYQADGNLVLYDGGTPLWASGTNGRPVGVCIMQGDGNLVIYADGGDPIWSSDTWQHPGSRLVVQNDGNVVIYTPDGTPVWATNTWLPTGPTGQGDHMQPGEVLNPGHSITSANGRYRFIYQGDGNLVLYEGGTPLWASDTSGRPAGVAIMQGDGNLVIYVPGNLPVWSSDTWQFPDSRLVVQDDGNVVIYRPDGTPVWATNTWRG